MDGTRGKNGRELLTKRADALRVEGRRRRRPRFIKLIWCKVFVHFSII